MDGGLLLDKALGASSNAALQSAKRLYAASKAGHGGTLDPLASGLLVVLFGEATKFAGPLLESDKEYRATVKLGERTSTGDAEGEVVERKPVHFSDERLREVLARFRGRVEQVPPMYSALKRGGVPLYRLARQGTEVAREKRAIVISELEALSRDGDRIELRIRCSKGTYVRVLAEDLAEALGTAGHLAGLRRTASGRFRVEAAVTLEQLEAMSGAERERLLLPLEALLADFPRVELDPTAEARFRQGQALAVDAAGPGLRAVFGAGGAVVGLGQADGGRLRPVRLVAERQAAEKHR